MNRAQSEGTRRSPENKSERAIALGTEPLRVASKIIVYKTQKIKSFNKDCNKDKSRAQAKKLLLLIEAY